MARLKMFSKRDKAAMKKLRQETTPSVIIKPNVMKKLYIVIWLEAIEASDLIAGIFDNEKDANDLHEELLTESSGDYWEVVTKDAAI